MTGRLPLHPFATAAVLVLVVWAANVDDVAPATVVPTTLTVLAVALAATLLGTAVLRDLRRGAFVGTTLTLALAGHGHVWGVDAGPWTVVVDGVVVGLVLWRVRSADDVAIVRATSTANGLGLAGAAVCALLVGLSSSGATAPPMPVPDVTTGTGQQRDLVWIVPDRYGGAASLAAGLGIDDDGFAEELRARGFTVAADARANYPRTALSLAAQLNLAYLDEPASAIGAEASSSITPLYPLLQDHAVGRLLRANGYRYTHLGSWWEPTATATAATEVVRPDGRTEFGQAAEELSLAPVVGVSLGELPADLRSRQRLVAEAQLDELERIARDLVDDPSDAPRLVVAHVTLPHEPYVFAADGALVTEEEARARTTAANFADQLAYLNDRLLTIVDILGEAPSDEGPVVLLQADEGPHPAGYRSSSWVWGEADDGELVTKLQIMAAVRVPGEPDAVELEPGITGVTVARRAVGAALGVALDETVDRSFVNPTPDDLYAFVDVTDRLDEAIGRSPG